MTDLKSLSAMIPARTAGVALAATATNSLSLLETAYLMRLPMSALPLDLR